MIARTLTRRNNPGKRLFIIILVALVLSILFACKSRKVAVDKSKTVDRTETTENSTVKESLTTQKTDQTITTTVINTKTGEKIVEEYIFSPSLDPKAKPGTGLPMDRLKGYRRTTDRALDQNKESLEQRNVSQTDTSTKDSTGSREVKKNLTTSEKVKSVDAKQDFGWVGWLIAIIALIAIVGSIIKNPLK